jgi:hypothetical protein
MCKARKAQGKFGPKNRPEGRFCENSLAALVYERTKMLVAPMVVHALYNAAVLGFQWTMMQ